jgi:hypothetical protein
MLFLILAERSEDPAQAKQAEAALADAWSIFAATQPQYDPWFPEQIEAARRLQAELAPLKGAP